MVASAVMKQYVIDQLQAKDYEALKAYLDQHLKPAGVAGLYSLFVEAALLADRQRRHATCQPHYFAIELLPHSLVAEFLVRTAAQVRCDCMGYADERQRNWLIDTVDAILAKLDINA